MKRKSGLRIFFVWLNFSFAFFLVLSIFGKYTSALSFSFLSVLSLSVPFFVAGNGLFLLYWILKRNKRVLISGTALLLGFFFLGPIYQIRLDKEDELSAEGLKVMTYNVRDFNNLGQIDKVHVDSLILNFIEKESPDIVCMQEAPYYLKSHESTALKEYNYKYIDFIYGKDLNRVILTIYSKYPILENRVIDFPKSYNSAMYSDILVERDTIRLFNLHLQSFKIVPNVSAIQKEDSKKVFGRLQNAFDKQQHQAEIIRKYLDDTILPKIVVGDFNNTQFSNVYQTVKGEMSDTYLEKGKGFGKTYNLLKYPMRIDYILADDSFEVLSHKNYDVELSDHYPVMATLRLKSEK